jgi:hypothetical protein
MTNETRYIINRIREHAALQDDTELTLIPSELRLVLPFLPPAPPTPDRSEPDDESEPPYGYRADSYFDGDGKVKRREGYCIDAHSRRYTLAVAWEKHRAFVASLTAPAEARARQAEDKAAAWEAIANERGHVLSEVAAALPERAPGLSTAGAITKAIESARQAGIEEGRAQVREHVEGLRRATAADLAAGSEHAKGRDAALDLVLHNLGPAPTPKGSEPDFAAFVAACRAAAAALEPRGHERPAYDREGELRHLADHVESRARHLATAPHLQVTKAAPKGGTPELCGQCGGDGYLSDDTACLGCAGTGKAKDVAPEPPAAPLDDNALGQTQGERRAFELGVAEGLRRAPEFHASFESAREEGLAAAPLEPGPTGLTITVDGLHVRASGPNGVRVDMHAHDQQEAEHLAVAAMRSATRAASSPHGERPEPGTYAEGFRDAASACPYPSPCATHPARAYVPKAGDIPGLTYNGGPVHREAIPGLERLQGTKAGLPCALLCDGKPAVIVRKADGYAIVTASEVRPTSEPGEVE